MRTQAVANAAAASSWLSLARRRLSSAAAVDSDLRRSVEEHLQEVSKFARSPKKANSPPPPYSIVKGALERTDGLVLRRAYREEEITISVKRRALPIPSPSGDSEDCADDVRHDFVSELFIRVGVERPGRSNSLLFLCGLYPDAVGIYSICLLPKSNPDLYYGRVFPKLNQKLRDEFCLYLKERAVDENLFPFLQFWLYKKDLRILMNWFKSISKFVHDTKPV